MAIGQWAFLRAKIVGHYQTRHRIRRCGIDNNIQRRRWRAGVARRIDRHGGQAMWAVGQWRGQLQPPVTFRIGGDAANLGVAVVDNDLRTGFRFTAQNRRAVVGRFARHNGADVWCFVIGGDKHRDRVWCRTIDDQHIVR